MAARGLLRLSSRLQKANASDLKLVRVGVHDRLNYFHATALSGVATRNTLEVCTDCRTKRNLHSLCNIKDDCGKLTPNNVLVSQYRYRSLKTSQTIDYDEDNGDSEEVGAFENYDLSEVTKNKLRKMGINHLFPCQYHTFKPTIEGTDVIVQARTGTGKTLSFALPIVEKLQRISSKADVRRRSPMVIVLAPTRELANQVKEVFSKLSNTVSVTCAYGGVPIVSQIEAVRNGVDVVVGTPGRVMDLMERGVLKLSNIEHVILDEVDQMLDMGFADDVNNIIKDCYTTGVKPQTMLYSATVPDWVLSTARKYLNSDYKLISLVGKMNEQTATTIKQYAMMCRPIEQPTVIKDLVKFYTDKDGRAIVFCQTKREADQLSSTVLQKDAKALHGDISQQSRSRILEGFKKGSFKVLVTTDVAARGLDIPNVDLVIQAQPPNNVNYYIHRVGRTGRAGKSGTSILLYERGEQSALRECEQAAKVKFEKMGIPTLDQMKQVCVREAVSDILKVPVGSSKHFEEAAEMLIKEKGAVSCLAAAMAIVSHADSYQCRSLITSAEGYATLVYRSGQRGDSPMHSRDKVFTYLKGLNIPVQNFHDLTDRSGVVFDVAAEYVDAALEGFSDIKMDESEVMARLDVLPSIYERGRGHTERRHTQNMHHRRQPRHRSFDGDDDDDEVFGSSFGGQYKKRSGQFRRDSDRGHYNRNDSYEPRHNQFRSSDRRSNHSQSNHSSWRNSKDSMFDEDF